ncbi:hypothetical protein KDX14_33195 [Burkholderia cenocepacia]|uniref:hypothetical protein n=1 Tax=Burkholderia cenocepacia TaxID=95486 RepID=UPI001B9D11DC|nr:hypothetical protein [Burkholderia cenocepacia]MBR8074383.1 hypothetical protein [Burkholderia cenocepacia]
MTPTDKRTFVDALKLAHKTARQPLPEPDVMGVFWKQLEPYPLDAVLRAISCHVATSEFAPTPAALLKHLPRESDGRPDANEAWAIALRSRDERDTVVWTQECAEAFAVATPVLEGGDEVGARMAFKAAYERLVERHRADGKPAQWVKSLGHDPDLREAVVTEAVRSGRLALSHAQTIVPALAAPVESFDAKVAETNLARLRALVGGIPSTREKLDRIRAAHAAQAAAATADAKDLAAARVADYLTAHA